MRMLAVLILSFLLLAQADDMYILSKQGESCYSACLRQGSGMICSGSIMTKNSTAIFQQLGVNCKANPTPWWANDQPAFITGRNDPNYGECLGYMNVPTDVWCGGHYPASTRLCHCEDPSDAQFFGTGYSGGQITGDEQDVFTHVVTSGHTGVMTHFWTTDLAAVMSLSMIRYYVDGETEASIQFIPSIAAGVGFSDTQGPWGTRWFGKGAKNGAWFVNFRIPFQKSIRVTTQSTDGHTYGGFYIIVRGALDLPISVGGINIPSNARLTQQRFHQNVSSLAYVPIVDLPSGSGVMWMHTIVVKSKNLNFLEGCYHAYTPYNQKYPGTLLSTGTEDYFDSAWYFDGGEFHMENAGYTHYKQVSDGVEWSAYRFHEMDPLPFKNGFKLVWRNGDALNPKTGLKCFQEQGGIIVGNPSVSDVQIYAWVYTW